MATSQSVIGSAVVNGSVNIPLNLFCTDDPSWVYSEVFCTEMALPPTEEQMGKIFRISPISKAQSVNVPVFIAAGGNDQCVSPHSSIGYYKILKSLGKDVKMFLYEKDGHSIATRASSYDLSVNVIKWMEEVVLAKNN